MPTSTLTVAVIAPGSMGSAIGARLAENGARVLTSLEGRSAASAARAGACSMVEADASAMAAADLLLSIVPPGEALALAERLAPALAASTMKPVYLDCNAVNPRTVGAIAEVVARTGSPFVDAGIIGGPPRQGYEGPVFYVSGPEAARAETLTEYGLRIRRVEGPVGAASALKMSYGGITKGVTALTAAMMLGATRAGVDRALLRELAASQPQLLARARTHLPDMYPKAYRWVAEMREIAGFLGGDDGAALMWEGAARLYERLASPEAAADIAALEEFVTAE
jgi:L-threonate 2-dehydrogenase